ncbi:PREDICTED: type II inositol 3,4-bisphosphate 4-phosphatase [Thamnophis sirtalis]|uniref:phosphatidylinositol-3,4-bisphosphate 4-phosphatase n=1 Tax=Thamnophis sirtalis TaxID=35019 RepID=A0A6I9YIW8_9SAUR|nr:PREDICTED: type II inositol 3,4-bisphosphate 4-phosphatase [Thamnophis sirtalis]
MPEFQSGEPDLYLKAAPRTKTGCESWAVGTQVNSEELRIQIWWLERLTMDIKEERALEEEQQFIPSAQADNYAESKLTRLKKFVNEPKFEFSLACKDLVAPTRDRKLNTFVQVTVVHPGEQNQTRYASTEIVEGTKDPLFLTGVTFPPDYPIYEETKIKLTVYDVKDKSQDTVRTSILAENKDPRTDSGRSFLGSATFKVGELVKSEEQQLTLSLRSLDGGKPFGTIDVRFINMGKTEDEESNQVTTDGKEQKCALVSSCSSPENIINKDNLPLLNAVLKNPICKLYTFPTSDNKWMYIREQMFESNLSFHIPKELISLHIKEDLRSTGYQCIYYSPENTAKAREVLSNINQLQPLISSHADMLLNSARQQLPESLKNSLTMLSETTELFVHAFKDQLIRSALLALYTARPGCVLKKPTLPRNNTEENSEQQNQDHPSQIKRQDSIPHHSEYDEEEWDRVWANVGKSLNCIIAMVDRLLEKKNTPSISKENEKEPSSESQISGDWYEQLYPLTVTLNDCIREVVTRAKESMSFVLLQELSCCLPQCLMLTLRRDIVFSQALAGLICGFIIKLHSSLRDQGFLQQLHSVGLIVQYEGLLSTYSDEIGMLEDMAVGISDLQKVMFKITETKSDDILPVITGRREHYIIEIKLPEKMFELLPQEIKDGKLLYVYPVLFNVGINEQQTLAERFGDTSLQESLNQENLELLKEYYKLLMEKMPPDCLPHFQDQSDLKGLLENLHQNIQTKKRKNVEIMWLAATICRKLNGVRFTCCKSAKDRTSMSVTLEQCSILRDEHHLHKDFFIRALDCMRRQGCRIENVLKNIKCRKYAFNMIQLMAFPKYYRPPEGTYGKADT